jgi:hypothetical protein
MSAFDRSPRLHLAGNEAVRENPLEPMIYVILGILFVVLLAALIGVRGRRVK